MMSAEGKKIGELVKQYRVGAAALRAWETRYGLFSPHRATNGYRYYTPADELRLQAMQGALARGMSAADAAALALQRHPHGGPHYTSMRSRLNLLDPETSIGDSSPCFVADPCSPHDTQLTHLRDSLVAAWRDSNEDLAANILDGLWQGTTVDRAIRDVLFPALSQVGVMWAEGVIGVDAEHAASSQAKSHLSTQIETHRRAHGTSADGPLVWLACPPGELHDLPLVAFALMCRIHGWRVRFFGASTPIGALRRTPTSYPDAIVIASTSPGLLTRAAPLLQEIAADVFVGVGGAGVSADFAQATDTVYLSGDIVSEAMGLRERVREWAAARPEGRRLHRDLRPGLSVSA